MASLSRLERLTIYRNLIKYGIKYPSIKRVEMLSGIHEDFYNARNLTDEEELETRWKEAQHLVDHFKFYHYKMQKYSVTSGEEMTTEKSRSTINPHG